MDEKMLLEAIGKMMDEKLDARLKPIEDRLDSMEEKLDGLIENHSMTRDGVNTLLGWADSAARVIKVPLKSSQE